MSARTTTTVSHHPLHRQLGTLIAALLFLSDQWPVARAQGTYAISPSSQSSSQHYIEYNLADYCSEENWSDYPGRHRIRLEKTVKIRRPSIIDFHYNETHRQRLGGGHRYGPAYTLIDSHPQGPNFVPYCLLSFYAELGYRIYAEGFATGLLNGGRDWFTETLHFRTGSESDGVAGGAGSFAITTQKETLSLVFEQLHLRRFSFHLVLTPFKEAQQSYISPFDGGGGCERSEYRCRNGRCIQHYLTCDHVNNCQDHSDEDTNCLAKVPTPDPRTPPPPPPQPPTFPPLPTDFEPPPQVPTFDVNGNRIDYPTRPEGADPDVPEYVDVPLPTDYPPYHSFTTRRPGYYDTMNGFGGHATNGSGGFLEDLFTFSSDKEVTKVVYLIRYLVGVFIILVMIMMVNLSLWCCATKNEESMMAPAVSTSPVATLRRSEQAAISQISVISDV